MSIWQCKPGFPFGDDKQKRRGRNRPGLGMRTIVVSGMEAGLELEAGEVHGVGIGDGVDGGWG